GEPIQFNVPEAQVSQAPFPTPTDTVTKHRRHTTQRIAAGLGDESAAQVTSFHLVFRFSAR
ncbi:MAG TPA: hypothetical protein PLY80_08010, partial [Pseudomonadota bacterium]|nr:hypothetical protein [Pseudomonadota bacterium]